MKVSELLQTLETDWTMVHIITYNEDDGEEKEFSYESAKKTMAGQYADSTVSGFLPAFSELFVTVNE